MTYNTRTARMTVCSAPAAYMYARAGARTLRGVEGASVEPYPCDAHLAPTCC